MPMEISRFLDRAAVFAFFPEPLLSANNSFYLPWLRLFAYCVLPAFAMPELHYHNITRLRPC